MHPLRFPAQPLTVENLHQEFGGISSMALPQYQSFWAASSLPAMRFGCVEAQWLIAVWLNLCARCQPMQRHCWVAMMRLLLLKVAVKTPLKKDEVAVEVDEVKMLSLLKVRGEEEVSIIHLQRTMVHWTWFKWSGFNPTSLEDFSYDLGGASAVLVHSFFVKWGQQDYGNSWDVHRSARHPMEAPPGRYGERSPLIPELS